MLAKEKLFNSKNTQRISNLSKFCRIIMARCKTDAIQVEPKMKKCKVKTKPKSPVTESHFTTSDDIINKKVKRARKKRVYKSQDVNKDNKLGSHPSHTSSDILPFFKEGLWQPALMCYQLNCSLPPPQKYT